MSEIAWKPRAFVSNLQCCWHVGKINFKSPVFHKMKRSKVRDYVGSVQIGTWTFWSGIAVFFLRMECIGFWCFHMSIRLLFNSVLCFGWQR